MCKKCMAAGDSSHVAVQHVVIMLIWRHAVGCSMQKYDVGGRNMFSDVDAFNRNGNHESF